MPPASCINKDFLKAVFNEQKSVLENKAVRKITVPRYEELSVANFMDIMKNNQAFMAYMPEK